MRLWTAAASTACGDLGGRAPAGPSRSRGGQADVRVGGPAPERPLPRPVPGPGWSASREGLRRQGRRLGLAGQPADRPPPQELACTERELSDRRRVRRGLPRPYRPPGEHPRSLAGLWRHHLAEPWADVPVDEVTPAAVRAWHAKAGRTAGPTALAQSYRLLRAVLNVAVADEVIARPTRADCVVPARPRPRARPGRSPRSRPCNWPSNWGKTGEPSATGSSCSCSPSAACGSVRPLHCAAPTYWRTGGCA